MTSRDPERSIGHDPIRLGLHNLSTILCCEAALSAILATA